MPRSPIQVTDQEIAYAYQELKSTHKVAERFGMGSSTVSRILKRQGIERTGLTEYRIALNGAKKPWTKYEGNDEEILTLYQSGMSMRDIATAIGRSTTVVVRRIKKAGLSRSFQGSGPNHSQWKGEPIDDGNGYMTVWVSPDDAIAEMRDHRGYVKEHRLVLARKLGRALQSSETVHHVDGNKKNNDPANLQLRQGHHGKHVVMRCLDCGSQNVGHVRI